MNSSNTLSSFLNSVRENETLLKYYSSNKCSDCIGRGYVEMQLPGESMERYCCSCVTKNVRKEFKKLNEEP